jgi:diguanylate cyclase (GGDEF)-like protein/PAS domain S-box-containing protein
MAGIAKIASSLEGELVSDHEERSRLGLRGLGRPGSSAQDESGLTERYRLLVDLVPDGVIVHQSGKLVFVNRAIMKLVGRRESELLGHIIEDFIHPTSRTALASRIDALLKNPRTPSEPTEVLLLHADGGAIPVETVSVVTSWEGRPAMQVILRDLTMSKAAEEALRYQAALVHHVGEAIIGLTQDAVVTSWNPAAEAMFDLSSDDALGSSLDALLSPRLPLRSMAGATPRAVTFRIPDGRLRSVRVTVTQMAPNQGYVLLCADETRRQEAERRFTAVISALEEAVVVTGRDGCLASANPAAERILGVRAADIVGCPDSELPLQDKDGTLLGENNPLSVTRRTGVPTRLDLIRVQRPDGAPIWLSGHTLLLSQDPPCASVLTLSDVTEHRAAAEKLAHAATHDPLTGLPNRELLLAELAHRRNDPILRRQRFAVLFLDLDGFKMINDTAGHEIGDEALQVVSHRLSSNLRGQDMVARLGGDEFVVVAGVSSHQRAHRLAERILNLLAVPVTGRLSGYRLRASIGLILVTAEDERTPPELLRDADTAMYQAKARGRNRVTSFDADLRSQMLRQLQLGNDLDAAVRSGHDLWVAYQPVVDATTGRRVGVEALARWTHPQLGAINPIEFITVAEQSDTIHALGRHVLLTACHDIASRDDRDQELRVAVNLSPRQLDDPALCDVVRQVLNDTGLDPHRLCLEVTESALATNPTNAEGVLGQLREIGIDLMIDDFGTGYSSLARLRDLPVNGLKIDRSFVTPLPDDQQARSIIVGIIALAHGLNMHVVAEGVETADHAHVLTDLHCDLLQGYQYGRPVSIKEMS